MATRTCETCGDSFTANRWNQKYCQPGHRPGGDREQGTTTQRGYGAQHQALRAAWAEHMAEHGGAKCHAVVCFMPSLWIEPDDPWDLGHTEDRTGWTGPEHRRCNRKEPQLRGTTPAVEPKRWVL